MFLREAEGFCGSHAKGNVVTCLCLKWITHRGKFTDNYDKDNKLETETGVIMYIDLPT